MRLLDLTGHRYGRLTVLGPPVRRLKAPVCWPCRCDCGNELTVIASNLRRGNTTSCGCFRVEVSTERMETHGWARKGKSAEYTVWCSIRQRCENPDNGSYVRYGGRGITVCERWHEFENFLADMGMRPTPRHQVDRIDNGAGYSPDNCRWATPTEQANNRRSNRHITYDGKTMTVMEWSRESGLARHLIEQRLDKLGWSVQAALTTPPRRHTKRSASWSRTE